MFCRVSSDPFDTYCSLIGARERPVYTPSAQELLIELHCSHQEAEERAGRGQFEEPGHSCCTAIANKDIFVVHVFCVGSRDTVQTKCNSLINVPHVQAVNQEKKRKKKNFHRGCY